MGETHQLSIDLFARFLNQQNHLRGSCRWSTFTNLATVHRLKVLHQIVNLLKHKWSAALRGEVDETGQIMATFWAQPSMGIPPKKFKMPKPFRFRKYIVVICPDYFLEFRRREG